MKHDRLIKILGVVCIVFLALTNSAMAELIHDAVDPVEAWNSGYYFVEEGPILQGTLYADGSVVELKTLIVSYPVIGSDMTNVTFEEFKKMVRSSREAFENDPNKIVVSGERSGRGLNIVFDISNAPPAAAAALESVATYLENIFADDITVTINIDFQVLPDPNVIGWASTSIVTPAPSWTNTRTALINDMDADDSIQLYLPSGDTIPVRYAYSSSTATNEDRCYFCVSNYNAVIGYAPGVACEITFNTTFSFDYDPSDGVSGGTMCFQSVAAHEIGHALGFLCGAWMTNEIVSLDIYRFQLSDGGFDYNPDDLSEFGTTARMVDESPGSDDVITDVISVEYQMSDGYPYQCSHFSQGNVYACMQPTFSYGQTYYPCFYQVPDRTMFDAIGWDYLSRFHLTVTRIGSGSVAINPDSFWYNLGTAVELTANPDPGWEFIYWTGDLSGSNNPDTVIMDDDKTVLAYFRTINCTLTVNVAGNGMIQKNPDLPYYPRGDTVELTAVPDPGWEFSHWSGNLWGSQNPDSIVMDGDKIVTAHFTETGIEEIQGDMVEITFLDVFPNPFSGRLTLKYGIAAGDRAKNANLIIYDVAGQLIKRFVLPTTTSIMPVMISWDGSDDTGRKVPSGVYFVKFETSNYKITKQILLLK